MQSEASGVDAALPSPGAIRRLRRSHPLAAMIVGRILAALATLLAASVLIFVVVQVLPGDAAQVALGRDATPERVQALRDELNLSEPLPERYWRWLSGLVTGDFGLSTAAQAAGSDVTVSSQIAAPLDNSLILTVATMIALIPLALVLGAWSAVRAGRPSGYVISIWALLTAIMPEFLIGTVLIAIFFSWLGWLPPISQLESGEFGLAQADLLVLPVLTLLIVTLGYTVRLIRAATIDVLRQNYVAMARINGYKEHRVIWRFALRNSLAPSVQALALTTQYLIGGIVIVENVFNYPGIGHLLVDAVQTRDLQMITIVATILAAIYVAVNIVADVAVILLSPRLRAPST
jgi:peptide/nickel transport system permease protein